MNVSGTIEKLLRIGNGQGADEKLIDDGEDGGVSSDAEGEGERGDESNEPGLEERPQRAHAGLEYRASGQSGKDYASLQVAGKSGSEAAPLSYVPL